MPSFPHFYRLGPPVSVPAFGGGINVRIGENALKSVVFFGLPSVKKPGTIEYGGTGFLVGFEHDGLTTSYLVTARHNADALDKWEDTAFTIRANLKAGGSLQIPVDKTAEWVRHPDDTVSASIRPCV